MNYHSKKSQEELKDLWEKYVLDCDYSIESMVNSEHSEQIERIIQRLEHDFTQINNSWFLKCGDDVSKIEKLLKSELYNQNIENVDLCRELGYLFKYFFRLKNRRDRENSELKAENARLRIRLSQYEQP